MCLWLGYVNTNLKLPFIQEILGTASSANNPSSRLSVVFATAVRVSNTYISEVSHIVESLSTASSANNAVLRLSVVFRFLRAAWSMSSAAGQDSGVTGEALSSWHCKGALFVEKVRSKQ